MTHIRLSKESASFPQILKKSLTFFNNSIRSTWINGASVENVTFYYWLKESRAFMHFTFFYFRRFLHLSFFLVVSRDFDPDKMLSKFAALNTNNTGLSAKNI
jgi:hypothetical protein